MILFSRKILSCSQTCRLHNTTLVPRSASVIATYTIELSYKCQLLHVQLELHACDMLYAYLYDLVCTGVCRKYTSNSTPLSSYLTTHSTKTFNTSTGITTTSITTSTTTTTTTTTTITYTITNSSTTTTTAITDNWFRNKCLCRSFCYSPLNSSTSLHYYIKLHAFNCTPLYEVVTPTVVLTPPAR